MGGGGISFHLREYKACILGVLVFRSCTLLHRAKPAGADNLSMAAKSLDLFGTTDLLGEKVVKVFRPLMRLAVENHGLSGATNRTL